MAVEVIALELVRECTRVRIQTETKRLWVAYLLCTPPWGQLGLHRYYLDMPVSEEGVKRRRSGV
jgi:hypothetical protein